MNMGSLSVGGEEIWTMRLSNRNNGRVDEYDEAPLDEERLESLELERREALPWN